jgi:hypothetical protein
MALNKITCGDCGKPWDDCRCPHHEEKKKDDRLKEQMKANGYTLDRSDNGEVL